MKTGMGGTAIGVAMATVAVFGGWGNRAQAIDFVKPTPQELSMKELPGYPNAAAVVLFREEVSKDDLSVVQRYERIKILTEEGKKYANVELNFVTTSTGGYYESGNDLSVGEIAGRTIHADGTIIPFTGKPYLKVIEKSRDSKVQTKVFTLPDVEVGSIIEYRYATRYVDHSALSPDWYIQGDLFVKQAHFEWFPTVHELVDYKQRPINSITWFPILPVGAKIERRELPAVGTNAGQQVYELNVKDVPPVPHEDHMPPVASYSYRVMFNFSPFRSSEEYWKESGREWSKQIESFTNAKGDLPAATAEVTSGATTDEAKLRKIYAAVMGLENTSYTREHGKREDKATGGKVSSTSDVWKHKNGNATELTELFVAMARAAGMKAYVMLVPDRSKELFVSQWQSFQQFDDVIAIVNVGGKEVYFDPGSRYCDFGHLAWQHSFVDGLREVEGGTTLSKTSGDGYSKNHTSRVANLDLDEHGEVNGRLDLTYDGAPALTWRHVALEGDEDSLKHDLKESMEAMVPRTLEVTVARVENTTDYEKPFIVHYTVKGTMGTPTGKRLVLPADLFRSGATTEFPHEKREIPVYFKYGQFVQDALRVNFKKGFAVEGVPASGKYDMPKIGTYNLDVTSTPTSFTTRRNYAFSEVFVLPEEYAGLRTFYSQLENKDQESVVLKAQPVQAASN